MCSLNSLGFVTIQKSGVNFAKLLIPNLIVIRGGHSLKPRDILPTFPSWVDHILILHRMTILITEDFQQEVPYCYVKVQRALALVPREAQEVYSVISTDVSLTQQSSYFPPSLFFLSLVSARLISSRLVSSHFVSFRLASSQLISSRLTSSRPFSSHLASSRLISSHLISSHLVSSRLISSHLISSLHHRTTNLRSRKHHHASGICLSHQKKIF